MSQSEAPGPPFQINKIGHIVINVHDLDRAARFYRDVLGFQVSDVYPNEMMPGGMVFLRCRTDHHTVALVGGAPEHRVETEGKSLSEIRAQKSLNHFAFEVSTLGEVFRARTWLRDNDVPIHFDGRRRAGAQIAVEFEDPDGNEVEIYWGVDQVGTDGQVRPSNEWRQAFSLEDAVANPVPRQKLPPLGPDGAPVP
jgi:catechol 2,3-dioxygenase